MMRALLAALLVLLGGCVLRPPLPPLELKAGEAFVAGVVSDRTDLPATVVAMLFHPPALLPDVWQPVRAASLVVGSVRPGHVLLSIGRDVSRHSTPQLLAGLPLEVPGPGCFWFGGVEVRREGAALALRTFDVEPAPVLARLAVAAPALAECTRAVAVLEPDTEHAITVPAW